MIWPGMKTELAAYEGLIHCTAERYVGFLDHDLDDIKQVLRVKVWQALTAYDGSRSPQAIERFVFSCMRNRVKDLLKEQDRRNDRRQGTQLYLEDSPGHATQEAFELRYLAQDDELAYAEVEDEPVPLPSTLTELERSVVRLLVLDYAQTEVARELGVSRQRVRTALAAVQEKMGDWAPPGFPLPTSLACASAA